MQPIICVVQKRKTICNQKNWKADLVVGRCLSGEGLKTHWGQSSVSEKHVAQRWHYWGLSKRPAAALEKLQEFLRSTGCARHVRTIYSVLHCEEGGKTEPFPSIEKDKSITEKKQHLSLSTFCKKLQQICQNDKMCYGLTRPRLNILEQIQRGALPKNAISTVKHGGGRKMLWGRFFLHPKLWLFSRWKES